MAAVFETINGEPPLERDLIITNKADHRCRRLSVLEGLCDPMVYPLLFPYGEIGWRTGLRHVQERSTAVRNEVTLQQFYGYRLAIRDTQFSQIHYSGKLFHQYIVDAYLKVEGERLNYIRKNQAQLRVDV